MEISFFSALSGNNSVKSLSLTAKEFGEEDMRSFALALRDNLGIEDLSLNYSDRTCSLLFPSMAMHPVSIRDTPYSFFRRLSPIISSESKTTVMQMILQMLHLNTVVHTINLPDTFVGETVYQNSILPRLEMNRSCFEVQRQAVKRAGPSIRPQLLGRALHLVRYNPNLVLRFLLENVPAFVLTGEEEEQDYVSASPVDYDPIVASGQKRKTQS